MTNNVFCNYFLSKIDAKNTFNCLRHVKKWGFSINEYKFENGEEYAWLTKTLYQNFDVGQTNFENIGKAYEAHVVSTTRSGMMRCMD